MTEQLGTRFVLDSKSSWRNLPYALMPAGVGLGLIVYPWVGVLDPATTAPIMLPFGIFWLLLALCISAYHSELVLDEEKGVVVYRTSLLLHSWGNEAARGNVPRVVLRKEGSSYRFVMELEDGEDITVTTFDYWRSREWSEHVAAFLKVPLVDECRDGNVTPAQELNSPLRKEEFDLEKPCDPPGKIEMVWERDRRACIRIPQRGLLPSARARLLFGALSVLSIGPLLYLDGSPLFAVPALALAAFLWYRPLAQATHREEIWVSPRGLMVNVVRFGRSHRKSLAIQEIRAVTILKGEDARFEHEDFDWHAVCVESIEEADEHLQLGANLPKLRHVEWLHQALLYVLTLPLEDDSQHKGAD